MAISQVPPLSSNVPIVYPPGHPSAGCPTPAFATLMQILLDEKAITDALAEGAIQPGTVTTSGLTAAAQRILGNKEATTGAIEELTITQALDLIAGTAAQGDIFYRGATSVKRLAAGTSGQFLKTLGAGADPAWATATSGGGGLTLISEQTPSGTGTVTFSSIPATYRDLIMVVRGRGDAVATTTNVNVTVNNDTGGNYDIQRVTGNGTTASAGQAFAQSNWSVGYIPAASAAAGIASSIEYTIHDYRSTTFQKAGFASVASKSTTSSLGMIAAMFTMAWRSTAAINRVDAALVAGNFVSGSVVSLYGRS